MFLIGHTAIGILLARSTGTDNPAVAFGVGWISHYLGDFIPHGDENLDRWLKKGNAIRRLAIISSLDLLAAAALLVWLSARHGFSWVAAAAFAGAILPDIMWGTEMVLHRPLFGPLTPFHIKNHNRLGVKMSLAAGLALQGLATGILWWVLMQ